MRKNSGELKVCEGCKSANSLVFLKIGKFAKVANLAKFAKVNIPGMTRGSDVPLLGSGTAVFELWPRAGITLPCSFCAGI